MRIMSILHDEVALLFCKLKSLAGEETEVGVLRNTIENLVFNSETQRPAVHPSG